MKPVPSGSKSLDIYVDRSGNEDKKRKALQKVADAMEKVLEKEDYKEHTNRGLRNKIVEQMGGNADTYLQAFSDAKLGIDLNDRARIARLADLFQQK